MYRPTGTNVTPLGAKRRFNDGSEMDKVKSEADLSPTSNSHNDHTNYSSSRQIEIKEEPSERRSISHEGDKPKRKRKSRWGDEQKVIIPGLPTTLPKLNKDQSDKYLLQIRLEEINRKLRTGDFIPHERDRSPSPEPIYNADGKRVNTREARYKKKLEDERHKLIETAMKTIPNFRPPVDYKRPTKTQEKVYIPAKEFPEINFIGQLIGPRGNTLKGMESDSGAKISIRGRGSVKEGKSRTDAASNAGQEEDLHCLVTADTEEKVRKAVKLINKVIETSASVPEGQNELKRNQLRELAALNGTLRDDENQTCLNCGASGHRRYECPERQNITSTLTCHICNGMGHIARDCVQRNNPDYVNEARERDSKLDVEYMNLMAELGESVPEGSNKSFNDAKASSAPWQHRPAAMGTAPPWQQKSATSISSAPPPWSATPAAAYGSPNMKDTPPGMAESTPWQNPAAPYAPYNAAAGYYGGYEGDAYSAGYGYYDPNQIATALPPPPTGGANPWQQAVPPNGSWDTSPPPPPPTDDLAPPPPPSDPIPPPPPPESS